jgi:4-amino-4-deoxy-L-arabinose transferase-like glycosyltransferase
MPVETSAPLRSPAPLPAISQQLSSAAWLGIGYVGWLWIIAGAGIAARLEQYFFNRSLWLDESLMALNVLHRSFAQLTHPLQYQLVAPLAWLFAEKSCSLLLGPHELSLRLVAIVGGSAAVLLVGLLARHLLRPRSALVTIALFAFSPPLIYYSSELKPYGTDPAACGLLWLLGFWTLRGRPSRLRLMILAVAGAGLFWFSHPVLFVACGFGIAIVIAALTGRDWARLARFVPVFLTWAVSFAVDYWFTLRASSQNVGLPHAYPFFTFPIRLSTVDTALQSIFGMQQTQVTLLLGVTLLAAVAGAIHFWREDRVGCCFLVLPVLFALTASSLHLYPLPGRFYLFFSPALFLLVGAGVEEIWVSARSRALPIALLLLLLFQPVVTTAQVVRHHMPAEELRPVLQYVQHHQLRGDTWYIYYYATPPYEYYAEAYGLTGNNVVLGGSFRHPAHERKDWDVFQEDFSKLHGRRVWVIFSHNWTSNGVDEPAYALHILDRMGTRKDAHLEYGAAVYLYELRPPALEVHPSGPSFQKRGK